MLRLITSLMGRALGQDTILPAKMTNHCKTLIPMGAGLVMGLEGRPLFTRPLEVSRHLHRLRTYGEERWAQKQRSKQAQKKARRDRTHGAKPQRNPATPADRRRCPAKGGAKRSALHYGTDFYAKPIVPHGRRHPPFKWWTRGQRMGAGSHIPYTSHHNTRAHGNTGRRHTSGGVGVRSTRTPTVQSVRAGTQGSTVLLCPRAPGAPASACHVPPCRGASPHPTAPPGGTQSQPEDSRSGRGGTTPSPQEARNAHAGEGGGGGAHTGGARRPQQVLPPARGDEATEGRDTSLGRPAGQTSTPAGAAWACRHRGLITPSRQGLWPRRG